MIQFCNQIVIFSSLLSSALTAIATRHYEIVNQCEIPMEIFINDESQGNVASRANITRELDSSFDGFIFAPVNGGREDGTNLVRAGFHGETNSYFIVIDINHLNTPLTITPINKTAAGGFCGAVRCDNVACSSAFAEVPTSFPSSVPGVPMSAPFNECPDQDTGYTLTFCPDFDFGPNVNPVTNIHPSANPNKCLDVRGAVFANGTPVQIFDCNETGAQRWLVDRDPTKVRVNGTNFCLDAGSAPKNGIGMKIWECFDGLPAQSWIFTNFDTLVLQDQGFCLDLTDGVLTNSNQVQIWECTDGDKNQNWEDSGFISPT